MERNLICFHKRCSCKSTKLDDISSAACINQDEDIGNFMSKKNMLLDVLIAWVTGVKRLFIVFFPKLVLQRYLYLQSGESWRIYSNFCSKRLILSCRLFWHWRAVTRPVCYISIYFSQVLLMVYWTRYHHQLWI